MKRAFDFACSSIGLLALSPLLLGISVAIQLAGGPGGIFYQQVRVGQFGKPFRIWKFRTMRVGADQAGPSVTQAGDPRITRVGAFLRRFKLDELPQLWNVVKGEMSLVGPRPEVPRFVERYTESQRSILRFKPGITDLATLCFREEEALLQGANGVEEFYVSHCLPKKISLNERYAAKASLLKDIWIILQTLLPYWLCVVPVYAALLAGSMLLTFAMSGAMPAGMAGWQLPAACVAIQLVSLFFRKEFNGLLSFFGWTELKGMIAALSVSAIFVAVAKIALNATGLSVRHIAINLVVSVCLLGGIRAALRVWRQWSVAVMSGLPPARALRVGIVGAGEEGASLAREIARRPELGRTVIAFFDDDPTIWRKRLHDIPVEGMPECLMQQQWDTRVDEVVLVLPDLHPARFAILSEAYAGRRFRQYHFGGLASLFGETRTQAEPLLPEPAFANAT